MRARNAVRREEPGPDTVAARVHDLHHAFSDPAVDAVMSTIGGWASYQLLPHLDYDLIAAHPKPFVGYSDTTFLHVAITERAGLGTVYGPAVLPQFGEYGGVDDYTWCALDNLLRGLPPGRLRQPAYWIVERLQWETEDDRPRRREWAPVMKSVLPGAASGRVLAANLETLACMCGTEWWPDLAGRVLFVEVSDAATQWQAHRALAQVLGQPGSARLAGLCLGWVNPATGIDVARLHRYAEELLKPFGVPLAVNVPFGHADPMISLAQGRTVELNCEADGTLTLMFPEPAVEPRVPVRAL